MKLVLSFLLIFFTVNIFSSMSAGGGGILIGSLTASISDTDMSIPIGNTEGWLNNDIIVIDTERIYYSSKTSTDLVVAVDGRGYYTFGSENTTSRTEAAAHLAGAKVYTVATSFLNRMSNYNIGLIAETEGWLAFIKIPIAILSLLFSLFTVDLSSIFGYSDYVGILETVWSIVGIAAVVWFVFTWRSGSTV